MKYDGLTIEDNGTNNQIEIEDGCNFVRSKIVINGNNNSVILGKVLNYQNLVVNFKGDNKLICIKPGNKNINNLKIVSIRGNNQKVNIGRNFSCGGIEIQMNDGNEQLDIGNDCLFSWGIKARTSDGHSVIDLETEQPINFPDDIKIGDSVWISEDVKILKGAIIPNDCVIASSAIVTKKFSDTNCVIAGIPAKVVKTGIKWDYKSPDKYMKHKNKPARA